MKAVILIAMLGPGLLLRAAGGTIVGTIRAQGKPEAEQAAPDGKYASHKYRFAERVQYPELRDFVICIEGRVGDKPVPPAKALVVDTRRITQKGAEFQPHVLPVVAGTSVEWPNHDDIFHNVFSMSEAKPFDLGLYKGNPENKRVTFDEPGRVDVFCSIHANMHCIVLVLENPYYTLVQEQGSYSITNVPPGKYRLKAWHERMPAASQDVTVPEHGDVTVDFLLGINNLPKY